MNTIIGAPPKPSLKGRIIVIEPDPARARSLKDVLGAHISGPIDIVPSADAALHAIDRHLPDVVLTSTFLSPSDELRLTDHLKALPAASHVQVIITPHFIDADEPPKANGNVFSFRRSRGSDVRPACDHATLIRQIGDYLQQARAQANLAARQELEAVLCSAPALPMLVRPETRLIPARSLPQAGQAQTPLARQASALSQKDDRRRAPRRPKNQLPGLWSAKLPWGTEVTLLDVSRTGMLVETTSRVTLGSTLDFQFVGENTNVCIPARILRTNVADVDAFGVRYRVAAAFNRELELLEAAAAEDKATDALVSPAALAQMLARVLADPERRSGSAMRVHFEEELRKLLPLRTVQIRHSPLMSSDEDESVYFNVPVGSGCQVLQATFEPDSLPSVSEFKLLRAAASLAAVLLEFEGDADPRSTQLVACR
jgi:CheY-like chemotaxis protein